MSDTHSRHDELDVPGADILIHAGDATWTGTYNQIRAFGKWLRALPHPLKLVVAGNHDWGFETAPAAARRAIGDGRDRTDVGELFFMPGDEQHLLLIRGVNGKGHGHAGEHDRVI